MQVRISEMETLLTAKLRRLKFTAREARIIADEYIGGDMHGKATHGVFSFANSYKRIISKGRGHFKVTRNRGGAAFIEGHSDVGQLAARAAIDIAVKKAKRFGVGVVGGRNIHSFLRPGTWAELAARKGMVALCFNYGGGPLIAPTGAGEAILSTNPISIGIPTAPEPLVLDMAVSEHAYTFVKMAKKLGQKLKGNWAIDSRGRPTKDPNKVAAVLPFGGYKGFGLAFMFEILTGPLVRTAVGKQTKLRRGFLFIVIDPRAFTTLAQFRKDVARLVNEVKRAKRLPGVKEIIIPGERAMRTARQRKKLGTIELDPRTLAAIKTL